MESKNNEFLTNAYNSYGPIVSRVCENTNNFIKENFLENINKNVGFEEPKINVPTVQFNPVSQVHTITSTQPLNIPMSTNIPTNIPTNTQVNIPQPTNLNNPVNPINMQGGNIESKNLPELNSEIIEEQSTTTSFLSSKIKIFGYELSIWMLILLVILLICIIYFIYKYLFSSNKLVNYKKNESVQEVSVSKSKDLNSNLSSEESNDSSSESSKTSKSSKSSKSSRSSKSSKSSKK